jgi:hypothetical protein
MRTTNITKLHDSCIFNQLLEEHILHASCALLITMLMFTLIKDLYIVTLLPGVMQNLKKLNYVRDLIVENGEEEGDPNMASNLLTVASTGNAAFLDELLKARLDPDIGDSKGRTPLVCF